MHGGHNWCSPRSRYFYWDFDFSTSPARASWSPSFSFSSCQVEAQRRASPQDRPQKSPQSHRLAFDQIGSDQIGFGQIGLKRKIGSGQIVFVRTGSGTRTVVGTGSEAESWSGTDSGCWGTAGWTAAHCLGTVAQTERLAAPTGTDSYWFCWSMKYWKLKTWKRFWLPGPSWAVAAWTRGLPWPSWVWGRKRHKLFGKVEGLYP